MNRLFYALAATVLFASCSNDDDLPDTPEESGDYSNGIFVTNEGNFGQGNASVSFVDSNLENVTNNVFSSVNDGDPLGDTAQSMAFYEDYAFIVVNASNKIEVVDRSTFERVATIDQGLINPRYVAFSNGNAYVTNWGDGNNPDDDFIAVIDVDSFETEENIGVVNGPDRIIAEGGRIYVAHGGGYTAVDNDKVSVIDAENNTLAELLTVGDVPNGLAISNNSLWVLSGGTPGWDEDVEETAGSITQIDLTSLENVTEFEFPNVTDHPGNLTVENGMVFYNLGSTLYSFDANAENLPEEALFEMTEVGQPRAVEVQGSRVYATSAGDYTSDGFLYVYDLQGQLLESFQVGLIPGGIFFNN